MKDRIEQWGNSLAIRIAQSIADDAGLEKDTSVRITVGDGKITIEAIRSRRSKSARRPLSGYLQEITPENMHGETRTGAAVGWERL